MKNGISSTGRRNNFLFIFNLLLKLDELQNIHKAARPQEKKENRSSKSLLKAFQII